MSAALGYGALLLALAAVVAELSPAVPTRPVWLKLALLVFILLALYVADRALT